jgi:DNA polymerase-3 subunit epsilon
MYKGKIMKLIAFDLEACNRYVPGSIFSVGVVEADFNFNIKDKYNILINPETKFVTKFRKPIEFNVDEKALRDKKNFFTAYKSLKKLFNQDAVFMAHSISNDIRMLNCACKRYNMPSFHFKFICSQMLYSIYSNTSEGIGLNDAGILMGTEFVHHNAEEDALISIKLVEYICKMKKVSLNELLIEYGVEFGSLKNFQITHMQSTLLDEQRRVRKLERIREKNNKIIENI